MARHRSAGTHSSSPSYPARPSHPRGPSPRRAARTVAHEEARRLRRVERERRRSRTSRRERLPLGERLLALPWVSVVLLALVAAVLVEVLRPDTFEARSTLTAATAGSASQAAVVLSRPDLAGQVEDLVELERRWKGSVRLSVERPAADAVVVRATARDPRLAALAADTAAALVAREEPQLALTSPAVVPTGPLGGGSRVPWALGGGTLLLLALLLERRRDRHELARQGDARRETHREVASGAAR